MKANVPIAVTSRSFSRHPVLRAELEERYADIAFNDEGKTFVGDQLVTFLKGKVKAITALEVIDDSVLAQLPDLKVISKVGVGLDMLDLTAMERHGVQLGWTGGTNSRSVSELVIAFAIALLRHIPKSNLEVRNGIWKQHRGAYLSNRTVGLVGCGNIGKDLVALLKPFNCPVICYDITDLSDFYEQNGVAGVSLEELLTRADIVSLHLPLNEATRNILNADRLSLMQPNSILINTARGGLVDEVALKEVLMNGKIAGAAFDVFGSEPPDDQELLNLPNFLATPHIGGSTEEAILAMGRAAIAGLDNSFSAASYARK